MRAPSPPLPAGRPWVMRMRWTELLFAHWPVDPATMRAVVPAPLELDTFEGVAWVGVVPFRMSDVGLRGLPAPPAFLGGTFPELNVRTYVTYAGRPGIWFISLDAASHLAVEAARLAFGLPYFHAAMAVSTAEDGTTAYRADRRDRRSPTVRFAATYAPVGPVEWARPGSFDAWATERMRLFTVDDVGTPWRTEIRHARWPLQPAQAACDASEITAAGGIALPAEAPRLAYARRLDVRGWWPVRDAAAGGQGRPAPPR